MPPTPARRTGVRNKTVRVWGLASITMPVGDMGFVKVEFGHERLAKSDTQAELERVEVLVHEFNVKMVEKRVRELVRLKKAVEVQESRPARRRAKQ